MSLETVQNHREDTDEQDIFSVGLGGGLLVSFLTPACLMVHRPSRPHGILECIILSL